MQVENIKIFYLQSVILVVDFIERDQGRKATLVTGGEEGVEMLI
jgi:hypothetical protein